MKLFIALCFCVLAAMAADKDATVVRESFDANPEDGSYKHSFETSNGIKVSQSGKQIPVDKEFGAAAEGSYSYTAPDGTVITLTYKADDNGFQPTGDHLPTPPPLPPVPAHVAKLLALIAKSKKA